MKRTYLNLAIATLTYVVCFAVWTVMGILAPVFRAQWGLSSAETSLMVAAPVLVGSFGRVPAGFLADRYGGKAVFIGLLILLAIVAVEASFADLYRSMLIFGLILGASGTAFAIGVPMVSAGFSPPQQGRALGVFGVGNLGAAVAGALFPVVLAAWGWRSVFWVSAGLLVATAILVAVAAKEPASLVHLPRSVERRSVFSRPTCWLLGLFYFVTFGGYLAFAVHMPTLLVQFYGISLRSAGLHLVLFSLLATAARPLGGYWADKTPATKVLRLVFPAIALSAAVLVFAPPHGLVNPVLGWLAIWFGIGNGAVTKLIVVLFPSESGAVSGLAGAIGGLGGVVLPLLQGIGQDLTGIYVLEFMLLAVLAAICSVFTFRLGRKLQQKAATV